jgi:hypothetical protein
MNYGSGLSRTGIVCIILWMEVLKEKQIRTIRYRALFHRSGPRITHSFFGENKNIQRVPALGYNLPPKMCLNNLFSDASPGSAVSLQFYFQRRLE